MLKALFIFKTNLMKMKMSLSGRKPLSDLEISQSFKLIVNDDVIVSERKMNAKTGVTNLRNYGPRNLRNLTKITYFDRNISFERIFNNDVSKQLSLVINLGINS